MCQAIPEVLFNAFADSMHYLFTKIYNWAKTLVVGLLPLTKGRVALLGGFCIMAMMVVYYAFSET